MIKSILKYLWCGLFFALPALASESSPLMRYPTTSATSVAFVAYDDLWSAPLEGGTAHRLVHDASGVSTPLYSPDGRWIAYTLRRGGRRDVFAIPAIGGEPRRLTFEAGSHVEDAMVIAWTPDFRKIVFLSHRGAPFLKMVRAFAVPIEGGPAELLPMDRSGLMSYAPDGHTIVFNRNFRNLELRKRYIGGQQQDLYTYNFVSRRLARLTHWKGTDTSPMWFGRTIYFLSDRGPDFRQNLWAYSLGNGHVRQITHFVNFDIDWPSLGSRAIAFQEGGLLYALDLPSERLRQVHVEVPDDGERTSAHQVPVGGATRVEDVKGGVDYAISPTGDALLISARGDLVRVAPHIAGVDLTNSPGVDEDHPSWSPDGQTIAYETDATGEQQLALRPASGGRERILTHFARGYFYTPLWSPQGDSLAVADANHSLWWIRLDGSEPQRIATDPYDDIRDAAFSPDGRWLAYSTQRATQVRAIHLHELATGKDTTVSSPMESDRLPAFTGDGHSLVFVSQRHEQLFVSDRDDESILATINSDGLYIAALQKPSRSTTARDVARSAQGTRVGIDLQQTTRRSLKAPPALPAYPVKGNVPGAHFARTTP